MLEVRLVTSTLAAAGKATVAETAEAAMTENRLKFIALVIQGIPRSYKLDSELSNVDVPLCPLELAAVQVGEQVAKVPDLMGLEALLVESGLA